MADWYGLRSDVEWMIRRVSWAELEELEDYERMKVESCEQSIFTTIKARGSISFNGCDPPDEIDPIRLYYCFTDADSKRVKEPVATFLAEASNPAFSSLEGGTTRESGTVDCYSLLKVLSDASLKRPLTVPAGTNAVAYAVAAVESFGLRTNNPDKSSYLLSSDHTFEATDSHLDMVNWLLDAAGFASATTDALGTVQIVKYVEPTERPVSWVFDNGDRSIMYPKVSTESDWRSIPNVYTAIYQTDEESLAVTVRNVDQNSKASLPNRGWRENSLTEAVSELAGDTVQKRLANLEAMAKKNLAGKSAEVEYVKFSCAYVPVKLNDAVMIEYSDRRWSGSVTDVRTSGDAQGKTDLEVRRFVRHDLKVEVESQIVYQKGVV